MGTALQLSPYPSIYKFDDRDADPIFDSEVVIQEKVDGSQFSFGVKQDPDDPETYWPVARSHHNQLDFDKHGGMFELALKSVRDVASLLTPGHTYRAEYLSKPRQNRLTYDRVPKRGLVLFDVEFDNGSYAKPEMVGFVADKLGMESVPVLFQGKVAHGKQAELIAELLERESFLGGPTIEGIVIKGYSLLSYGETKPLFVKFVGPAFREVQGQKAMRLNYREGVITSLLEALRTEARWYKAVQHLSEKGGLTQTVRDIGPLLKEVQDDISKEDTPFIEGELLKWGWKEVRKGVGQGLADWYKAKLERDAEERRS